jgi:glyoxylase-like metal-dependent hydrolase (beta-lactamase superfamily II)
MEYSCPEDRVWRCGAGIVSVSAATPRRPGISRRADCITHEALRLRGRSNHGGYGLKLGRFSFVAIETGTFRLDGGAMFGVVPKVLWSRTNPADKNNRIDMAMRALYVEGEGHRLVIDSGTSTSLGDKMMRNYVIASDGLRTALDRGRIDPDAVTDAVATHLHFDHAAGFAYMASDGRIALALPNARHYIQRRQWVAALNPNEKDRASFFPEYLVPIEAAGRLHLVDGVTEIFPGVTLIPTDGHTMGHQVVLVDTGAGSLLYCGDLIPLASHVNLPYIMAYDHFPLKTLEEKKQMLGRAADEGWILFFEHDPTIAACRVRRTDSDGFEISEIVPFG